MNSRYTLPFLFIDSGKRRLFVKGHLKPLLAKSPFFIGRLENIKYEKK